MLDKVEPPTVPDGYGLSVGFYCLVEAVRTIQLVVEGGSPPTGKQMKQPGTKSEQVEPKENDQIIKGLFVSKLLVLRKKF